MESISLRKQAILKALQRFKNEKLAEEISEKLLSYYLIMKKLVDSTKI